MLAIRMQRTGRKGHAMFRVIVQDSRRTPSSGKVVAVLGNVDPHAKVNTLDKEKTAFYLSNGAQPSDRVARLLKNEGVKLPDWVKISDNKERTVRNPEKRRSTAPAEEAPAATDEAPATEAETSDAPAETAAETPAEEVAASEPASDAPATESEEKEA